MAGQLISQLHHLVELNIGRSVVRKGIIILAMKRLDTYHGYRVSEN